MTAMLEKKTLTAEELESQVALELPDRELMALIDVEVENVKVIDDITVTLKNLNLNVVRVDHNTIKVDALNCLQVNAVLAAFFGKYKCRA
jgi:hypothetical protein